MFSNQSCRMGYSSDLWIVALLMSCLHRDVLWSRHRWVHIFTLPAQRHMCRPCWWIQLCLFTWFYRSVIALCKNGCGVFLHNDQQQLKQQKTKRMSLITATVQSRVLDLQALVSCYPHGSQDSKFPSWILYCCDWHSVKLTADTTLSYT